MSDNWQDQYYRDGKFYPPQKHPVTGEPDMCEWEEFLDVVQDHPEAARAAGLPQHLLGNGAFWYGDKQPQLIRYPSLIERILGRLLNLFW